MRRRRTSLGVVGGVDRSVSCTACVGSSSSSTQTGQRKGSSGSSSRASTSRSRSFRAPPAWRSTTRSGQACRPRHKKLGMSYSTQGAADFTPAAQTPVVDAVCTRHPSLLLIAPTDPVALRPAIQRCMNDGVDVSRWTRA